MRLGIPSLDGLLVWPSNSHQDRERASLQFSGAGNSLAGSALFFAMIITKTFEAKHTTETPTDADLETIKRFALRSLSAEDVWLGKMALANDQTDRSGERFPISYLQRFADTLPGKPVLTGHDQGMVPVGKFYSADVVPRAGGTGNDLIARYYLRADNPLAKDIELGIASGVSIGARADKRFCGLSSCKKEWDGKDRCNHAPGQEYNGETCVIEWGGDTSKVEAIEGSLVAFPCQMGAQNIARNLPAGHVIKAVPPGGTIILDYGAADPAPQGDAMELKEALEKIASLETEIAALKTDAQKNEPLVEAGQEYIKHLTEDAITKSGAVSDADKKQTEALLGTIEKQNARSLTLIKTIHGSVMQRFDEKFPPKPDGQPRDPNQPPGDKPANAVRRGDRIGGMV